MKKFVTTRGCLSENSVQTGLCHEKDARDERKPTSTSSELKSCDEILDNDSGIVASETGETPTCCLEKLQTPSQVFPTSKLDKVRKFVSKGCERVSCDLNNNLLTSQSTTFDDSEQLRKVIQNIRKTSLSDRDSPFPPGVRFHMESGIKGVDEARRVRTASTSNPVNPAIACQNAANGEDCPTSSSTSLTNRKFIKRHEAASLHIFHSKERLHNNSTFPRGSQINKSHLSLHSVAILNTSLASTRLNQSPCAQRKRFRSTSSLQTIGTFGESVTSLSGNRRSGRWESTNDCKQERFLKSCLKPTRYNKCNQSFTLTERECYHRRLRNPALKRRWYSSDSIAKHAAYAKLPEIIEKYSKLSLRSSDVLSIQSKYLGAESLSEALQDFFLMSSILKRFSSSEPPDRTLTLEEFKAKRVVCKRAIRNFTINIKNTIMHYESLSFVDACRLSCCLSYADVVACICLLLDYISLPNDRNTLARKVYSVGNTFCRTAILANSSSGKSNRERTSKEFFSSTDGLIKKLNDLIVYIGNLKHHCISRKF